MRYFTFALLLVMLTGCTPNSPTSNTKSFHLLQGTWRWIRFDQTPVHDSFYIRFYPDGRAATWPALKECVYQVKEQYLIIRSGVARNYAKVKFLLKGNEMIMIDSHTNQFIYQRIVPDLRPGQFLAGQSNNGTTPNLIIHLLRPDFVQRSAPTAQ